MLAEDIDEFQVTPRLVVVGVEQAHRRQEWDPQSALTIETAQQEHGFADDSFEPPCGHHNTGLRCECQGNGLPEYRVHFVSLARELGNRELAVAVLDRSFRPGTTKR